MEDGRARTLAAPRRTWSVRPTVRGAIAGAIVVLCAAVAAWWLWPTQERGEDAALAERGLIKEVKPAAAPVAAPVAEPTNDMQETTYKQPDPKFGLKPKKWLPTKEEVAKARLGRDGKPRKKSIYKTPTEQALGQFFSTKLGNHPPMIPNIASLATEKELEKFFSSSFEAPEDASEAVKENRRMMRQVKEELKQFVDEGGSVGEFVDYYRGQIQTAYDMWKDAETILIDMVQGG